MQGFRYERAASLREAAALLEKNADGAILAGGQTLIPTLKQRLAMPELLIDIGQIQEIRFIREEKQSISIGAATPHAEVAASSLVKQKIPALAQLAGQIGDPHVRHMGTIGGSLANNDPAADYPAAALALNAVITTNQRQITANDFFTGLFETALNEGEIITHINFPFPKRAAYVKFPQPASLYALAGVFAAETAEGPRIAVTGAGAEGVFQLTDFEKALAASWSPKALQTLQVPQDNLGSDIHAAPDYRAHLIGVLARRAVDRSA